MTDNYPYMLIVSYGFRFVKYILHKVANILFQMVPPSRSISRSAALVIIQTIEKAVLFYHFASRGVTRQLSELFQAIILFVIGTVNAVFIIIS